MLINNLRELDKMAQIHFTANEMVTAIANNETANSYMQDRFERAEFAEYLQGLYGMTDTAAEVLEDLTTGKEMYEGDEVTCLYADLIEFRYQNA